MVVTTEPWTKMLVVTTEPWTKMLTQFHIIAYQKLLYASLWTWNAYNMYFMLLKWYSSHYTLLIIFIPVIVCIVYSYLTHIFYSLYYIHSTCSIFSYPTHLFNSLYSHSVTCFIFYSYSIHFFYLFYSIQVIYFTRYILLICFLVTFCSFSTSMVQRSKIWKVEFWRCGYVFLSYSYSFTGNNNVYRGRYWSQGCWSQWCWSQCQRR